VVGLGFELRTLLSERRCSTTSAILPVYFAVVTVEMESAELFALAGTYLSLLSNYDYMCEQ
jgi:hypothetical protein